MSPYPKWKPGDRYYTRVAFTTEQVEAWYRWYLDALADGINFQIDQYKRLGFAGDYYILMPGQGVRPLQYRTVVDQYLDGTGDNGTAGSGARWVSAVADRYGFAKNGENPGMNDSSPGSYGRAMLNAPLKQMESCHMQGMLWAHEFRLYDGSNDLDSAGYGLAIAP